jgi:hypothetical protein
VFGRTTVRLERTVPVPVSGTVLESLVGDIRRAMNDVGVVSLLPQSLSYTTTTSAQTMHVQVLVERVGSDTRIVIDGNWGKLAGVTYGAIGGGVGGGLGGPLTALVATLTQSPEVVLATLLSTIAGAAFLARSIFVRNTRRHEGKLEALMEQLEARVRSGDRQLEAGDLDG